MKNVVCVVVVALLLVAATAFADCANLVWTGVQTVPYADQIITTLRPVDYDHDGKLDLVGNAMPIHGGNPSLTSWRGLGNGTFENPVSIGSAFGDLEFANVNGDGYLDLVSASGPLVIRLGNATGFDPPTFTYLDFSPSDAFVTNINNDNIPDLLLTSASNHLFALYAGNGNGTFTEVQRVVVPDTNFTIGYKGITGDFDNDGHLDVAISRPEHHALAIYFGSANGTFPTSILIPTREDVGDVGEFRAADFNEDGLLDLAWVMRMDTEDTIDVALNQGNRTFGPISYLPATAPSMDGRFWDLILADVDRDSHVDILGGGMNNKYVATLLGQGDGTFAAPGWSAMSDNTVNSMVLANFDTSDADDELVTSPFYALQSFNSSCASQVLLTSVSWTIGAGQTARLRAIVGGVTPLTPLPRGTVTFREGATVLGTSDVDANGVAMLDHAGFAIGNHTLTADFSGNAWLGSAQSNSFVQRVFAWSTSTTMTIGASTHGEPFQSTVVPHDDLNNQNTAGWCYLTVDGVTEPYKRNTNFPITLTLNAGPHTMSAEFLGGYVPPSTSPTYSFTTAKHAVYVAKTGDTTKRAGTRTRFRSRSRRQPRRCPPARSTSSATRCLSDPSRSAAASPVSPRRSPAAPTTAGRSTRATQTT